MADSPFFIDTKKITTIKDVLDELEQLDTQLSTLGLSHFKLFNSAYHVVTSFIQQAIDTGDFKNPVFIEQFIVTFANYYFKAVTGTVNKYPNVSLPWAKMNEYARHKSSPEFISLLLGANAHINNDLPQALKTLLENADTEVFFRDIAKIDKLLMKSGKEIIGLFEEPDTLLDFLKRRFQFMYYRPAMYTILYWRVMAWRSYRNFKKDRAYLSRITGRSNNCPCLKMAVRSSQLE